MEELSTRIGLRSDTLENWTTANPILLDGEVAVVFDGKNQIFKVGNGISSFNQLPFSFYEQFASKLINTDMLKAKSISQGYATGISGIGGIATGYKSEVSANFAQAHGYQAKVSSDFGFVWNGDNTTGTTYSDHGVGSFSINPKGGLSAFYVGDKNLKEVISAEVPLSGFVKLSSDETQSLSTNLSIDGFVKVGGLAVQADPVVAYDGHKVAQALGSLQPNDLNDDLKQSLGVAQGFRYKLINGVLQHGSITIPGIQDGECDYIHIEDYAVTTITLSTMNNVVIFFPSALDNRCRDFILKVKIETETAPEHIAFVSDSGEPIAFETEDDNWSNLQPGINYMLFTETERT